MFEGVSVALVTPFRNGLLDEEALRQECRFILGQGVTGLFPTGCTGEAATLSMEERLVIWRICVEEAKGKARVVAGTGTNDTVSTLALTRSALECGVDGCMLITPYYNKPGQEGLFQHFSRIADAVQRPVILYNVPGRTGVDLTTETATRLASHGNIAGIKEATGELDRVAPLRQGGGPDFLLLSGDDGTSAEFMLLGGDGCISVTANVAPGQMRALCDAARSGNRESAIAIDTELRALHEGLFLESNPIPVKWAVEQLGYAGPGIRLPLTGLAAQHRGGVLAALHAAGIEVA